MKIVLDMDMDTIKGKHFISALINKAVFILLIIAFAAFVTGLRDNDLLLNKRINRFFC